MGAANSSAGKIRGCADYLDRKVSGSRRAVSVRKPQSCSVSCCLDIPTPVLSSDMCVTRTAEEEVSICILVAQRKKPVSGGSSGKIRGTFSGMDSHAQLAC